MEHKSLNTVTLKKVLLLFVQQYWLTPLFFLLCAQFENQPKSLIWIFTSKNIFVDSFVDFFILLNSDLSKIQLNWVFQTPRHKLTNEMSWNKSHDPKIKQNSAIFLKKVKWWKTRLFKQYYVVWRRNILCKKEWSWVLTYDWHRLGRKSLEAAGWPRFQPDMWTVIPDRPDSAIYGLRYDPFRSHLPLRTNWLCL